MKRFDVEAARALGRSTRFFRTPIEERHAIICRGCGSARVDHVARDRLRCTHCGIEDVIGTAFAILRGAWLSDDLAKALETGTGGAA